MLMEPWSKMIKHAVPDPEGKAWDEAPEERRIVIMWGPCYPVYHPHPGGTLKQEVLWYTKSTAPTLSDVQQGMML